MIELQPWSNEDFFLLEKSNSHEQNKYIGEIKTPEELLTLHERYQKTEPGVYRKFKIVNSKLEAVGRTGYWERIWNDDLIYEAGWGVLPEYQGGGIATQAVTALIGILSREAKHRYLHAFPSLQNDASNALCKKLRFIKIEECERFVNWRLDLFECGLDG